MKRKEIIRAIDPNFIHMAQYSKELPVKNFTGAKYRQLLFTGVKGKAEYTAQFNTNSATFPGEKEHQQFITLLGLRKWLKNPKPMLLRDKLLKAVSEEDLLVGCTCEAFCLKADTKIKLINGEVKTIEALKDDFDKGKKIIVFSTDDKGDAIPGEVNNIWISGKAKQLIRITLDNGREVETTLNHKYRLRDGSYKEAKDLTIGQSLMPLYFHNAKGYDTVKKNTSKKGQHIGCHTLVARKFLKEEYDKKYNDLVRSGKEKYLLVHHKDFNKSNNNPENLQWMGKKEHDIYHSNLWDANKLKLIAGIKKYHSDITNKETIHKDRSSAGRLMHKKYPEHRHKFNKAGQAFMNTIEGRKQAASNLENVWKKNKVEMIQKIQKYSGTENSRLAKAERMKHNWESESFRVKVKKVNYNNLPKTGNMQGDQKLLMGIGRVMSLCRQLREQNNLTEQGYATLIRKKVFKWQSYFKDFDTCIYWFNKAYAKNQIHRIEKQEKKLMVIQVKDFLEKSRVKVCLQCKASFRAKSYEQVLCSKKCKDSNLASTHNHKITKIELINYEQEQPVYDISVEGTHNFYVDAGIILHNCYWGYAYICTKKGIIYPKNREIRPPKIRNSRMRGIICKHLNLCLNVLPFNVPTILKDLKKKELEQ